MTRRLDAPKTASMAPSAQHLSALDALKAKGTEDEGKPDCDVEIFALYNTA